MARVCLISCVKKKARTPQQAATLYSSPLFHKMKCYAESVSDLWFILSAEHGLLRPTDIVAPYERTLKSMSLPERRQWAARVYSDLSKFLSPGDDVVVLAGR